MSGGSFEYLYQKPLEPSDVGHYQELLDRMAGWLLRNDFLNVAKATAAIDGWTVPSDQLREVWKAVEWFTSADWDYGPVIETIACWREAEGDEP